MVAARNIWLGLLTLTLLTVCPVADAQEQHPQDEYITGTVEKILSTGRDDVAGIARTVQQLQVSLDDGQTISIENGAIDGREEQLYGPGERLVLERLLKVDGSSQYLIRDRYRLPAIGWLVAGFLVLATVLGGWTGLLSVTGLGVSILVLVAFVMPRIAAGDDPLLVSLVGAVVIACTSLFLAHGFNRRTAVALLSTLLTLAASVVIATFAVHMTQLFGMGSEESMFLQIGSLQNVDLRGLLLAGIVIGCLGVLDDITTAQTAAIDEIAKANPSLTRRELMAAGTSVGREHIASLINTIALAYVGTSFPLLLLLQADAQYPLWSTVNNEFFAEEIVRTLVGSATLILAVPLSTWLAAVLLPGRSGPSLGGHHHHHHHSHARSV